LDYLESQQRIGDLVKVKKKSTNQSKVREREIACRGRRRAEKKDLKTALSYHCVFHPIPANKHGTTKKWWKKGDRARLQRQKKAKNKEITIGKDQQKPSPLKTQRPKRAVRRRSKRGEKGTGGRHRLKTAWQKESWTRSLPGQQEKRTFGKRGVTGANKKTAT